LDTVKHSFSALFIGYFLPFTDYRPPPAQAHAQPAQAQAHAQLLPPLLPLLLLPDEDDFGTGLVLVVMRSVKLVTLPTTSLAKPCIPVTTEAANSPPGKLGIEGADRPLPDLPPVATGFGVTDLERPQPGS